MYALGLLLQNENGMAPMTSQITIYCCAHTALKYKKFKYDRYDIGLKI